MAPPDGPVLGVINRVINRVIAVDWSGRREAAGQRRAIWLCEWDAGGVARLVSGYTREAIEHELVRLVRASPATVIGLDFAFAFPRWFMEREAGGHAPRLWERAAREGDQWLADCAPPFWGRPGRKRPMADAARSAWRATEQDTVSVAGTRPKSVFQVGGAGAVGTGSVRGMPLLPALQRAGAAIWPFDDARLPTVVEIYPRLLTGPVTKSRAEARAAYLAQRAWGLDARVHADAAGSEDAFDALASAQAMWQHRTTLATLPDGDATARIEGTIWAAPVSSGGDAQ